MYDDIAIFIPTKGRLNNQKTYNILTEIGLKPTLVIEPQEAEEAIKKGYDFLELPENNKGISYSRNFILDFSRSKGYDYICMIDDDIQTFGYIVKNEDANNKFKQSRKKDNKAFLEALDYFEQSKTCGTMQYTQFAWNQQKAIVHNRAIEVVWFLYLPLLNGINIPEDTIEDRDFSLDIILNHSIKTFRLNHLYFLCPSMGTNNGGIETSTRYNKQIEWSKKMEKKWGSNICEYVIKKNKTPDIKIHWRSVDKILKLKNIQNNQLTIINSNKVEYEQLQFPFMKEFIC